jgi:dipeptidyl aminopeptidase/acylaminoacyl peptidase
MRTSAAAAAVLALTLGLGAGGDVATPASASNGPIRFVGSRGPDFFPEIYSVAPDGSRRLDLTNDPAADESPAISPDGREIAFVSTRDGYEDVFVMSADGSDPRRVCPQASLAAGPCITDDQGAGAIGDLAWSPTGWTLAVRVVFPGPAICLAPADANYLLDLSDGHPRQFAYGLLGPLRFSPDGRFVAWASWSCIEGGAVSVARADSGQGTGGVSGLFEDWAPRGLRLLYDRGKRSEQGDYPIVYPATMDPFGRHRWTLRRIAETAPTWSPGGVRIAFFQLSGPRQGLYIVHVGRHDARRLRPFVRDVRRSAWSPNGRWIAFGGAEGTHFVRSNGTGLRRVGGAGPMSPYSPLLWSRDSSHFAFVDGDGVVRVVSPPQRQAAPVTSAPSDLEVCRVAIDLPVCQIAWAGDRLIFASRGSQQGQGW